MFQFIFSQNNGIINVSAHRATFRSNIFLWHPVQSPLHFASEWVFLFMGWGLAGKWMQMQGFTTPNDAIAVVSAYKLAAEAVWEPCKLLNQCLPDGPWTFSCVLHLWFLEIWTISSRSPPRFRDLLTLSKTRDETGLNAFKLRWTEVITRREFMWAFGTLFFSYCESLKWWKRGGSVVGLTARSGF